MKRSRIVFLTLFSAFLMLTTNLFAQVQNSPIRWKSSHTILDDGNVQLTMTARISRNWHLYSIDLPKGGPNPTTFTFVESPDFALVGGVVETGQAIREHDEIFDVDLVMYADSVTFTQIIKPSSDTPFTLTALVDYQTCHEGQCNVGDDEFTFSIAAARVSSDQPVITPQVSIAPDVATPSPEPTKAATPSDSPSLVGFFILCFLAGLAGLLTPCVFPMIPMTVSFFLGKKNRTNALLNAAFFGLSIIGIYTLLGLLVSLTGMGAGVITDVTSHWITNLIFFLLFAIFAAAFFGMFEIRLPSSLSSKTDANVDKGGFVGTFFFALTTVIVSLSCVGPIVGALLVESASGTSVMPVLGMFAFSLGFSIPFTLFAIFPSWLDKLPKSGGWMNAVKIVLGFIVLAFSLKFLLGVDAGLGLQILSRPIFLAIWIGLALFLTLYLLGFLRFKMDSPLQSVGFLRMLLALGSFAFALYLLPGLFGAPLTPLSGFLPAQRASDFSFGAGQAAVGATPSHSTLCDAPKYADFIHMPLGLEGYREYNQALACAQKTQKPLLVEFTGHGCANCKEMASKVLSQPEVASFIMEHFIFTALYVDERHELPEREWYTSPRDNQLKKTIGKQNQDLQATKFNSAGQPNLFVVSPDGAILAGPLGRELDTQKFLDFLKGALAE